VNALSARLKATVHRNGKASFEFGVWITTSTPGTRASALSKPRPDVAAGFWGYCKLGNGVARAVADGEEHLPSSGLEACSRTASAKDIPARAGCLEERRPVMPLCQTPWLLLGCRCTPRASSGACRSARCVSGPDRRATRRRAAPPCASSSIRTSSPQGALQSTDDTW